MGLNIICCITEASLRSRSGQLRFAKGGLPPYHAASIVSVRSCCGPGDVILSRTLLHHDALAPHHREP